MSAPTFGFLLAGNDTPDRRQARLFRHRTGAQVLVEPDPALPPFAAVTIPTRPADDSGIAHVLEHLIFRGSSEQRVDDLYAELMLAGPASELNARTRAGSTTFHLTAANPTDRDAVLKVLLEALHAPQMSASAVEEERAIVANEMAGFWANPAVAGMEALRADMFPGSAHARAFGGLPDQEARLSVGALRRFHQHWYSARNLHVHLMGDGGWEASLAWLDPVFSAWSSAGPAEESLPRPELLVPVALPPDQAMVALGWRLPEGVGDLTARMLLSLMEGPEGPFRPAEPLSRRASLAEGDGAAADIRVVFPVETKAAALERAGRIGSAVTAMFPGMAQALPAVAAAFLDAAIDETGKTRHDRIAGGWCAGADPIALLQRREELDALTAAAAGQSEATADLLGHLTAAPVVRVLEARPGAGFVPAKRSARPSQGRRMPLAHHGLATLMPLPRLTGKSQLKAEIEPEPVGRRVLALSLASISTADLPLAGALARGLAARTGMQISATPSPDGDWLILSGTASSTRVAAFDQRLHEGLAAAMPALAPPADMPAHLQIETRLWAALSPVGAVLHRLRQPVTGAPGPLRRRAVLEALCPDMVLAFSGPVPKVPESQADARSRHGGVKRRHMPLPTGIRAGPGLATLGLGLRLIDEPALPLIAHALEWLWLRERLRRQGGAYGVRCRVGPDGTLVVLSVNDPRGADSFAVIEASAEWLEQHLHGDLLERARRGALCQLGAWLPRGAALARAVVDRQCGGPGRDAVWQAVAQLDEPGVRRIAARMANELPCAPRLVWS